MRLGAATGIQSAAARKIAVPDLITTVLTLTAAWHVAVSERATADYLAHAAAGRRP